MTKTWRIRCAEHVAFMEDDKCVRNLTREIEVKRPLRRTRYGWDDKVQMDLELNKVSTGLN